MNRPKIKSGQAIVVKTITEGPANPTDAGMGIRLIKFRGRYYTVYGRMFAVAGDCASKPWSEVCQMRHYAFCDWNTLRDMYAE